MSDLFGGHIVCFPTRWPILYVRFQRVVVKLITEMLIETLNHKIYEYYMYRYCCDMIEKCLIGTLNQKIIKFIRCHRLNVNSQCSKVWWAMW